MQPRAWLGLLATLAACAILVSVVDARLLRTPPDDVPQSGPMTAYAEVRALPVYVMRCAGCHGADMRGVSTAHTPDLTHHHWLYGAGAVSEIERTILYGIRSGHGKAENVADMPAFLFEGRLSSAEIGDASAYVLQLEGRAHPIAAAARGRSIFQVKGVCYDCHGVAGGGNSVFGAPNLRDTSLLYGSSRSALIRSIAEGRHGVCPAWINRLAYAEIRALAVMIHAAAR